MLAFYCDVSSWYDNATYTTNLGIEVYYGSSKRTDRQINCD